MQEEDKVVIITKPWTIKIKRPSPYKNLLRKRKFAPRGKITCYSSQQTRSIREYIQNKLDLNVFCTFTFPNNFIPMNRNVLISLMKKLQRKFRLLGVSGIIIIEFESGRPHFHACLNQKFKYQTLNEIWRNILSIESEAFSVIHFKTFRCERSRLKLASYCSKPKQKKIPLDYTGTGKLYCTFGEKVPCTIVEANLEDATKGIRLIERAQLGRQRKAAARANTTSAKKKRMCRRKNHGRKGFTAQGTTSIVKEVILKSIDKGDYKILNQVFCKDNEPPN